ncbi:MAG: MoaD/ThiS family protein [Pseudomonadota bacterium]|nr:MoaD/ThiS family protein [Pseudomonadota bacterium]|tara:strand:- start:336 stop:569 length:234 start_codon:yes stop_codon:yes gene_type:complete
MKINVKYFAGIRDLIGKDSEKIETKLGLTVEGAWNLIANGRKMPENLLAAVNHEYVSIEYVLKDGDELAFFPPVTGG